MPNNCLGTVTLYASEGRIKEVLSAIRGNDNYEDNPFDFDKIIPMPEEIKVTTKGNEDLAYIAFICDGKRLTIEEFLERSKSSEENIMLCDEITRYLWNETKDERISRIFDRYLQEWDSGNANKMLDEGILLVSNIRNYGAPTWYEWCVENWGTKWNSCDTYISGNALCFWTAWSPCLPVIEAMSKMFPDVIIDYWYEEPGMSFCGREIYLAGKPIYTEEADLEEHWIDDEDFEQYGYSEGYHDRKTVITEDNNMYTTGTYAVRDDCDEHVRIENGTFINYGLHAYREVLTDRSFDDILSAA